MLDGLLQWALNPTSMSAGYGINENYPYIKENLKLTHLLSDSKAEGLINKLECELSDKIIEIIEDFEKKYLKIIS